MQYNPFDPAVIEDPYPVLAELRRNDPVHHSDLFGFWMLSRYDDVRGALRNPEVFSSEKGMGELFKQALGADLTMARGEGRNILASDAPVHTRLRKTVNRVFTPQAVRGWEAEVRTAAKKCVAELLDAAEDGPVDIVEMLFAPLPGTMIAAFLGIEPDRREQLKQWATQLLTGLMIGADPDQVRSAGQQLNAFFDAVVEDRMRNPGDDTISLLVSNGSDGEDPLSFDEMVGFATVLLVGGIETTTNLLGNWMAAMLENRDFLEAIKADPERVPISIEEALRYDTPTQIVWRGTTEHVDVAGVTIPKDAQVGLLLGSANRDASKWGEDADQFRDRGEIIGHVGLGFGPHVCLGSHFARLEIRSVIETLLEGTGSIEPAGPAVRTTNFMERGFDHIPLHVKRAR